MKKAILVFISLLITLLAASCSTGVPQEQITKQAVITPIQSQPSTQTPAPARVVKVYGTPTWTWCAKVKEFLDQNRVKYQYFDVSADRNAYQEMVNRSHQTAVPQIFIDGDTIIGFNENQLRQKLGLNAARPRW